MPDFGSFRGFGEKLVQGQTPTQLGLIGSFTTFEADAVAFFDRVNAAGGTLSATEQLAVNTLVIDMKAAGVWTAMKAVYPMVGASAAACAQNLKSASFTGTFNGGWTFASTGVTPNGTSAFLNSALVPSTQLTATSTHISYYSRTETTVNSGVEIGTYNIGYSNGIEMALNRSVSSPRTYLTINSTPNATNNVSAGNQVSSGFFTGCRTSSSLASFYKNGSSIGTNTNSAILSLSSFNIYIGASNDFGTAGAFSTKQCAFASIGDGLTDTQASNFYTAVQAFQTTLGRQV
jgi:hypothetical protein